MRHQGCWMLISTVLMPSREPKLTSTALPTWAQRWYDAGAKPKLERTIATPGAWEAQGVGNATALMHHQLLGVEIPRAGVGGAKSSAPERREPACDMHACIM